MLFFKLWAGVLLRSCYTNPNVMSSEVYECKEIVNIVNAARFSAFLPRAAFLLPVTSEISSVFIAHLHRYETTFILL